MSPEVQMLEFIFIFALSPKTAAAEEIIAESKKAYLTTESILFELHLIESQDLAFPLIMLFLWLENCLILQKARL